MLADWLVVTLSIGGMLGPFLLIGMAMAGGAILWGWWKGKTEATGNPPRAGTDSNGGRT